MTYLEAVDVSKSFAGVQALTAVHVSLAAGRVRAVVGENGAGKSTLMRILSGVTAPDKGTLVLAGNQVSFHGAGAAASAGVVMVHQELALVPGLTIADNVMLGRPRHAPWRIRGSRAGNRFVADALAAVGLDLDPRSLVADLSVAHAYLIEIVKALVFEARVVIFDEPTAALPEDASTLILDQIGALRDQGCAIAFISHRLGEVKRISDDITVMRDGKVVADFANEAQVSEDHIIALMVDRPVGIYAAERPPPGVREVLTVRGLRNSKIAEVDFSVRDSEIVGLAGLVGSGRSETARAISGADRLDAGSICLEGKELAGRSVKAIRRGGIVLVPEDRKQEGIVRGLSVHENLHIGNAHNYLRWGLLRRKAMQSATYRAMSRYDIRSGSTRQQIETLSGGNQQKVILARAMETEPRVLILDEPTRGVDIRAKDEIHRLVLALAARGTAVILISSELEEVLALSHRVVVLAEGRMTAVLSNDQALTPQAVMRLATPALDLKGVSAR